MTRSTHTLILVLAALTVTAALPATASAVHVKGPPRDSAPCSKKIEWVNMAALVHCPLWSRNVPVYKRPFADTETVGYIRGRGRFFYVDGSFPGGRVDVGRYWNTWWSVGVADNGQVGFVNQVYFSGGPNNYPDEGLAILR